MRKFVYILILALLLVQSCDAFRRLAGRPTSEDIRQKRTMIAEREALVAAAEAAAEQARLDSIAEAKHFSDSIAALDSLMLNDRFVLKGGWAGGDSLAHRYYVIVSAFSVEQNAERMVEIVNECGYSAELIPMKSRRIAVGLEGSDTLRDAYFALRQIREERFAPKDTWILDTRQ